MEEIRPCPFCGSTNIDKSIKTSGRWERLYHVQMYCKKCHTYGPRVLLKVNKDAHRSEIEYNQEAEKLAIDKWNERKL